MKLNFIKMNPTENMTVLILNPLPRDKYIEIANKIMNYNNLYAEQVGFIEKPERNNEEIGVRLHMMGGEFCCNASCALAAALVDRNHYSVKTDGNKHLVKFEVSGADEDILCEVSCPKNNKTYEAKIKMSLPKSIEEFYINYKDEIYEGHLVKFPGIVHYVVSGVKEEDRIDFFKNFIEKSGLDNFEAIGIMFLREEDMFITPLVYVRKTDSLVWERGCGSGSTATGIVKSYLLKKNAEINVNQPGGTLKISTNWTDGKVSSVYLTGTVNMVAEGVLHID
ncbi:hypothetical protein [Fusobacterium sp. MFO224]|uniref:hypothetical protein n=1 Tax=Fusobacterium sp. MFO224 TaxID=3378070 RepID=UPI003852E60D